MFKMFGEKESTKNGKRNHRDTLTERKTAVAWCRIVNGCRVIGHFYVQAPMKNRWPELVVLLRKCGSLYHVINADYETLGCF